MTASELSDEALVRRLLERMCFHAAPDAVADGVKLGPERLVESLLATPASDAGVSATPAPTFPDPQQAVRAQLKKERRAARQKSGGTASPEASPSASKTADSDAKKQAKDKAKQVRAQQTADAIEWYLDRMVAASHGWTEKRTWLWHNHWATSIGKVRSAALMIGQNQTERTLGGGNFETLARAMIIDPALMLWLDAEGNTKDAPNENLAREFMELFTLGVGHYSETDVRQAAAALTGYKVDRGSAKATFDSDDHAPGPQTILGVTKNFDAAAFVDLVANRADSPRYLATRFWGWLLSDSVPSSASLDRMVAAYGSGKDLTAMFRAMMTDPAMRSTSSVAVKDPVSWLVGALRALGVRPSKLPEKQKKALAGSLNAMGQVPFKPPNVGGWPVGAAWLNTAATQGRLRLAHGLVTAADLSWVSGRPTSQRIAAVADRLGTGQLTSRTTTALAGSVGKPTELVTLALCCSEFTVSR